jgi:hypothetical protein
VPEQRWLPAPDPDDVDATTQLPGEGRAPRLADLPLFHQAAASLPAASPADPAALPGWPCSHRRAPVTRCRRPSTSPPAPRRRSAVDVPPAPPRRVASPSACRATTRGAVDWGLVRTFRQRASQKLAEQLRARPGVDDEDRRELGRSIVRGLLEDHARTDALGGTLLMELEDEQALAAAIFDSLFGLGGCSPGRPPRRREHRDHRPRQGAAAVRRRPPGARARRWRTPTRSSSSSWPSSRRSAAAASGPSRARTPCCTSTSAVAPGWRRSWRCRSGRSSASASTCCRW